MANFVNPPPFLRIPPEFLKDRVTRAFFEQQNTVIFQLWEKLGGNDDPLNNLTNSSSNGNSSQVQWMQKQISGLPEFTVDTSGFTIDTSLITTDKAVA